MKILVISQYFNPDITAAANRISESVDLLSKAGHELSVITAIPHKSKTTNYIDFDKTSRAEIIRVHLKSEKSGGPALRLIRQYLSFSFGAIQKVFTNIKSISPDVVWISSPPLPITLTSLVIKFIYRVPIVLDVRDIWPESAVNIGKVRRGSIAEKLGLFLEKLSYNHANEITCVSSNMRSFIIKKTSTNVSTIYNAVLKDNLYNQGDILGDPNIFCYAGNIGHAQDIEVLIRSFANAIKHTELKNSFLHIIGDGALLDSIKILVSDIGIKSHVRFFGALEKSKATEHMLRSGCLLLPLKDAPAFRLTVPSKVFDYMSIGRPIITNISGEGSSIIKRGSANVVVSPSDAQELTDAMIMIKKSWHERIESAKLNTKIIRSEFTREKEVSKLENVLFKASRINK